MLCTKRILLFPNFSQTLGGASRSGQMLKGDPDSKNMNKSYNQYTVN